MIAGLTGGIATGKSTVSGFFRQKGAEVIDADIIARDCVRKHMPAWRKIIDQFSREILLPDEEIDRGKLGEIIFNSPGKKEILNSIVHPCVHETIKAKIYETRVKKKHPLIILDIPLIYETNMYRDEYPIIVVYVPPDVQLERLMRRDSLSKEQAMARISSQMPIETKRELADIIIDNAGTPEQTEKRTHAVFLELTESTCSVYKK